MGCWNSRVEEVRRRGLEAEGRLLIRSLARGSRTPWMSPSGILGD